jgi:hypothetical protein
LANNWAAKKVNTELLNGENYGIANKKMPKLRNVNKKTAKTTERE